MSVNVSGEPRIWSRPGDRVSLRVLKRDRYIPLIVQATVYDAHGNMYHQARTPDSTWAVELDARRFFRGWPDNRTHRTAEPALLAEAEQVFREAGVLVPAQAT